MAMHRKALIEQKREEMLREIERISREEVAEETKLVRRLRRARIGWNEFSSAHAIPAIVTGFHNRMAKLHGYDEKLPLGDDIMREYVALLLVESSILSIDTNSIYRTGMFECPGQFVSLMMDLRRTIKRPQLGDISRLSLIKNITVISMWWEKQDRIINRLIERLDDIHQSESVSREMQSFLDLLCPLLDCPAQASAITRVLPDLQKESEWRTQMHEAVLGAVARLKQFANPNVATS